MKKKISNLLIVIVFIGMITLPQILSWIFQEESKNISTAENRNLSKKPILELATITKYPEQFDNYYNDHLPFRTNLIDLWTNINYDLFNTTVDNRVVIGKEGWLFYRGDDSIGQVQGISRYTDKEKQNILNNLIDNKNKLKEKNIEMYVFIVPNKENIYREYLPDSIPIKDNTSKVEDLMKYIKENSDINIVYPKQELLLAKEKYQVYSKYDTHWNGVGACIGAIALQNAIDPNFKYDIEKLEIYNQEKINSNDLANFASLGEKLYENQTDVKNFYTEITYKNEDSEKYSEYISDSLNNKTVLFIGDSFRINIKPYFSKLYKRVRYLHKDNYTEDIIENIEPDIIVYEAVERYAYTLNKKLIK